MATYNPVRKTASGVEDVTFPISAIDGLEDALGELNGKGRGIYYIEGTGNTEGTWLGSHDDIDKYYSGLTVAYKIPVKGASPTTLNINSLGAAQVVRAASSAITTHYAVDSVVILVYTVDASGTAYWKTSDYDSNNKTTTSNLASTKLFLVGAKSQSTSGQTTYSNKNCYVGTDNHLYSGGVKVQLSTDSTLTTSSKSIVGAINEINSDMPVIRLANVSDDDNTFIIEGTNKLTFSVEIVGGGPIQVGDTLQICALRRYEHPKYNEDRELTGVRRKWRHRRFAEYEITSADLTNKILSVSISGAGNEKVLFNNGRISAQTLSPLYLRIRRPVGELQNNDSGMTVDARFSNVITVWKTYDRTTNRITIH